MAMTVGELVGFIDLEDKGFAGELDKAGKSLGRLQSTTTSKTADIESVVKKTFFEVEEAIKDGLDPAEALADLDRLERGFDAALAEMLADADRTGKGIVNELRSGIGDLDQVMREAGERAGDELVDGLKDGLRGADRAARNAGKDAGKGFGDGVESSGGGRGGGRMSNIGANMVGGLKAGAIGIAAAAGAAIGGALMDAIANAMDAQKIKAKLAAQLGLVGEDAKRAGELAGEVYRDGFGESLGDVSDALSAVISSIDGMRDANDGAVKDMTAKALNLGETFEIDVAKSVAVVGQMVKTGLVKDADEGMDLLAATLQKVPTAVREDLVDALDEYGPFMEQIGIKGQDAFELLLQSADKGRFGLDKTGDALKEFTLRATDMSDGTKEAYEAIGLDQKKMTDALLKGGDKGREAFEKIVKGLRGIKDPTEKAQAAIALFGTPLEDLSTKDIPKFLESLDTTSNKLGDTGGAAEKLGDTLKDTAASSADQWSRSWEGAFSWMGEKVMDEVRKMFPSPADWEEAWGEITGWFEGTVGPFFSEAWNSVAETTSEIWNGIGDWLSEKTDEIVEWVGKAPGEIGKFFSDGWNNLQKDTAAKWEEVKSSATKKADELVAWLESIPGKIRDFFVNGWNDLQRKTGEQWAGIKKAATDKADELVTWLRELPGKIKEIFASAKDWLIQSGRDMIAGFINGIQQKAADLVAAARGVVDRAINAVTGKLESNSPSKVFERIGGDTIEGFILGVNGRGGLAAQVMQQMVGKAVAAAQEAARKALAQKAANIARDIFGDVLKGAAPNMVEGSYGLNGPNVVSALGDTSSGALFGGSQPAGVTVNIKEATVREEADFAKIGSAVTFAVMGRGTV